MRSLLPGRAPSASSRCCRSSRRHSQHPGGPVHGTRDRARKLTTGLAAAGALRLSPPSKPAMGAASRLHPIHDRVITRYPMAGAWAIVQYEGGPNDVAKHFWTRMGLGSIGRPDILMLHPWCSWISAHRHQEVVTERRCIYRSALPSAGRRGYHPRGVRAAQRRGRVSISRTRHQFVKWGSGGEVHGDKSTG
jgi:hypothetical protein